MRNAETHSETPILDLLQPLPEPDMERISGRFAVPFLTFVGLIVLTGNLSFLRVPLGFLLINFVTILIHEFGHLIAGLCAGLRFKGLRIDPFRVKVDSGKLKFRIRPRLFWGFTRMSLDRVRRVRRRLIIVIAGGPAASILCGVAAVLVGEIGLARYDSAWPTFLEFLGAWSLIIGCISFVPFRARGFANDGMLLRALLFSKSDACHLIASFALSAQVDTICFSRDYIPRWFRMAAAPTRLPNEYYPNWLAYENSEAKEVAARHLERCLAQSARLDDEARDMLVAEATFFTACRRNDAANAEIWRKRVKSPGRLHPVWQARMTIALLCANKQFEAALVDLDRGLSLIREAPDGAHRRRTEAAWLVWKQEIQKQVSPYLA